MDESLRQAALEYHRQPTAGKIAVTPTKALTNQRDLALAYSPGVAAACDAIVADPAEARTLTVARQPGRRRHQRHRGARPRQHRAARRQAGDGRQGRACSRSSPASTCFDIELDENDPDKLVDDHRRARADLRRHQPRGHQGAGVLLHRAQAARAHEDPGLPRRPARHRDRRRRGDPQRPASVVGKDIGKVKLVCSGAGAAALACLDLLVEPRASSARTSRSATARA